MDVRRMVLRAVSLPYDEQFAGRVVSALQNARNPLLERKKSLQQEPILLLHGCANRCGNCRLQES